MWMALSLLSLHLAAAPVPQLHLIPKLTLAQAVAPADPAVEAPARAAPYSAPPLVTPEPAPSTLPPPSMPPLTAPPVVPAEPPAATSPAMPPLSLLAPPRQAATGGYMAGEGAIAIGAGLGTGLVLGIGTLVAMTAANGSSSGGDFFGINSEQISILVIGLLLELVIPPIVSALSVVLFADTQHLTYSTLGAIFGAYGAMALNVVVALVLPPVIFLVPITGALGAVMGANLFAPTGDPAPSLLSPTARTVVASW